MLRFLIQHSGWLILSVHKSEKVGGYSPPCPPIPPPLSTLNIGDFLRSDGRFLHAWSHM